MVLKFPSSLNLPALFTVLGAFYIFFFTLSLHVNGIPIDMKELKFRDDLYFFYVPLYNTNRLVRPKF